MGKKLITACLLSAILSAPAFSDDADVLKSRLDQINSFYASFTQRVTSAKGAMVQDSAGKLWVKRPNLFHFHITFPDEIVLVSDGKTLWFYNPFIAQATATWLKNTTGNTPIILITRNNPIDWNQYHVTQKGNRFSLEPKSYNSNLNQLTITVTANGTIEGFTTVGQDRQRSVYELSIKKTPLEEDKKFYFTLPEGVTLDDQR
ncbi:outer membrane lipoprotein chaperone LolA [secondary endosymbiont of Ctenarytaina eucalypti]|uniref:Outer-membrane lipoprotein carrier protein n=1 Tax=secondary endosymbiont of Ctenarytaina eucalypti TaxID=1199245 RepID=J3YS06_9ENTR|nr:outer membrane lipoprotein chaperone LolA [secondary endosymbiont of Ctenarytaina eucalypti]AFP84893.1 periplasmic chaperone LolA [secondary endosymbiont of Ctenarytaina eucalypti]